MTTQRWNATVNQRLIFAVSCKEKHTEKNSAILLNDFDAKCLHAILQPQFTGKAHYLSWNNTKDTGDKIELRSIIDNVYYLQSANIRRKCKRFEDNLFVYCPNGYFT